jgi:two-component system phosphate regulon sensor histidine kinase PhoR
MNENILSSSNSSKIREEVTNNPLLRALLDVVREAVLIVDLDTKIVFTNRAAREIFAFPTSDQPGLRLTDVTRNKEIYTCFTTCLKEKNLFEKKIHLHTNSGERKLDLKVESITTTDLNGIEKIIGVVGTFFDNTKLEALEQMRREFFANLSHELRTPLTSIETYAETLLSGALYDNENNVKFVEIIAKHAARMRNLAQDISDLAAIESGKVAMRPQRIKITQTVREVAELLKDAINSKKILFSNQVPEDLYVFVDAKALEQILFNLVQNAVNFNQPNGSITVTANPCGDYQLIKVTDTGIGIENKHIQRIFERLYRVDESRSRKEGGTGLGLAIVKHLVQAQGGAIFVESTPNQGSTFSVSLPTFKTS